MYVSATFPIFFFTKLPKQKQVIRTIVIEAGHDSVDLGARGTHTTEANICLQLGLKPGNRIKIALHGVKVLDTLSSDILPGN